MLVEDEEGCVEWMWSSYGGRRLYGSVELWHDICHDLFWDCFFQRVIIGFIVELIAFLIQGIFQSGFFLLFYTGR